MGGGATEIEQVQGGAINLRKGKPRGKSFAHLGRRELHVTNRIRGGDYNMVKAREKKRQDGRHEGFQLSRENGRDLHIRYRFPKKEG